MEIIFNKRPIRTVGIFIVKITSVEKKYSKDKKTYYLLRLENDSNYLVAQIYPTKSYVVIDIVFNAVGLKRSIFDDNLKELIGKELSIKVIKKSNIENENLGIIREFYNVMEYRGKNFDWNIFGNEESNEDNSASLEDVFCISREELASEMGIDPNEVTDGDFFEYAGY